MNGWEVEALEPSDLISLIAEKPEKRHSGVFITSLN
jgi:hypothetical protein